MDKMAVVDLQTTDPTEFAKRARKLYVLLGENGYRDVYNYTSHDDNYLAAYVGLWIIYEENSAMFTITSFQDPTAKYEDYFGIFNPFL